MIQSEPHKTPSWRVVAVDRLYILRCSNQICHMTTSAEQKQAYICSYIHNYNNIVCKHTHIQFKYNQNITSSVYDAMALEFWAVCKVPEKMSNQIWGDKTSGCVFIVNSWGICISMKPSSHLCYLLFLQATWTRTVPLHTFTISSFIWNHIHMHSFMQDWEAHIKRYSASICWMHICSKINVLYGEF